ncbi:MAG TPA: hypothetical protein VHE34_19000 [Puia sp.]|uniref:hypothetical protein n=1 Tax=Puia sp. TaxID=2045100 RepID=UPI002B5F6A20|nr:hypothetical protein [Puia sp.]HVU97329.1 hypothetical protein [Puia sp.]
MFISHRHYLNEVPVEGKKNLRFLCRLGFWDRYHLQIIRTDNCISLLTTPFAITEESFWNINHFEDLAKYVFWTFNKSFLLKILGRVESQRLPILLRCRDLLAEYPVAYKEPAPADADQELLFCYRKSAHLKTQAEFALLYQLDAQNRQEFLTAVEKRINDFPSSPPRLADGDTNLSPALDSPPAARAAIFLEMLRPMNGSPEDTLEFMISRTEEAGCHFKLFSPVKRLANGKNPYGFNGCVGGMIDFFYQQGYFKQEYNLEQVFEAYLRYSGNSIGKFKSYLSEFRNDRHYREFFRQLKGLKISKLS